MLQTYRNELSELSRLSEDIAAFCRSNRVDGDSADALQLCMDEVATNIISYAWQDGNPHQFTVCLERLPDCVRAIVRDDGKPFDPVSEVKAPDLSASVEDREIGGLGIHFCRTLMHRMHYQREEGKYNTLTLERTLKP